MDIKKNQRRINALARLEAAYNTFKEAKKDKESYESTRNGRKIVHSSRSYEDECKRFATEIANLKSKIK